MSEIPFLRLSHIPYTYIHMYVFYTTFFIHSHFDRHLRCFCSLAIVSDAVVNMNVQIYLHGNFISFSICPLEGFLGLTVVQLLNSLGTFLLFSLMAASIRTNSLLKSVLLHILINDWYLLISEW